MLESLSGAMSRNGCLASPRKKKIPGCHGFLGAGSGGAVDPRAVLNGIAAGWGREKNGGTPPRMTVAELP